VYGAAEVDFDAIGRADALIITMLCPRGTAVGMVDDGEEH